MRIVREFPGARASGGTPHSVVSLVDLDMDDLHPPVDDL
jgi:hypothetical protein